MGLFTGKRRPKVILFVSLFHNKNNNQSTSSNIILRAAIGKETTGDK